MDELETKYFIVSETLKDMRLDQGLVKTGVVLSRSQGQKWIDAQLVSINGKVEKASYKLQIKDHIEVRVVPKPDIEIVPYDFPLDIVFEDNSVIVVNKPSGLVVHPAAGHPNDTLVNALLAHRIKLSGGSEDFRPGLVHRIDKGTSGLIVLAKTEEAHHFLAKQFLNKTIHRKYWAVSFGIAKEDAGTIEGYLERDTKHRKRFQSKPEGDGKFARTHYKVLARSQAFTLMELHLETGRTHQIRIHLSSINLPIAGDDLYNGQKLAKNLKNQHLKKHILKMERFALHAKELGFVHPETKEKMTFNSKVADDLHTLYKMGGFPEFID